jgi:hypothetical protein
MSLLNFGVFKEGVRDIMSNEIKVVTQQFKENKEFNQELPEKNVVYWTKKYYSRPPLYSTIVRIELKICFRRENRY